MGMRVKPTPLATTATTVIAAVALIGGLSGCGTSAGTSGADAASSTTPTSSATATAMPSATSTTPGAASSKPSTAKAVAVTIKSFMFTVPTSVAPGSQVTVNNQDGENHTVTSTAGGAFDARANAGGSATFTAPTKPGSYPFACGFHSTMKGTLVVR